MNNAAFAVALERTAQLNRLEDEIAQEWYGCSYDELGYDEREEVSFEAQDRMEV